MPILYAVVAHRVVVLARHADCVGNFDAVTDQLLTKVDFNDNQKRSYQQDRYLYHYACHNGRIFLCLADDDFRRETAFQFLETIRRKFETQFGSHISTSIPLAMNSEFSPVIASEMKRANSAAAAEPEIQVCSDDEDDLRTSAGSGRTSSGHQNKVDRVRDEVERVKDLMVSNIDALLERGERLDLLVDKTEHLSSNSVAFKQTSRALARKMWWQNTKTACGIVVVVLIAIYIVVSVSCGGMSWPTCVHRNSTL